jgi:hypothetical protein
VPSGITMRRSTVSPAVRLWPQAAAINTHQLSRLYATTADIEIPCTTIVQSVHPC